MSSPEDASKAGDHQATIYRTIGIASQSVVIWTSHGVENECKSDPSDTSHRAD